VKDEKQPKVIELDPVEWMSERPQAHQPFFGKGLAGGLIWLTGFAIMFSVAHYFRAPATVSPPPASSPLASSPMPAWRLIDSAEIRANSP
jgi:hypothetical protein